MINTVMPVLIIMGMALVYAILFVFFGYFTNRSVKNALLRRSSIHGHPSIFRKCYYSISRVINKEECIPRQGNKALFVLTPIFIFSISLALWTNAIKIPGDTSFTGNILTVYTLLLLLTLSLVVVAWASNSKYPILASFRLLKMFIPVEIALLFLFFSVAIHFNTFEINEMVKAQSGGITDWGIFKQPLIALTFLFLIMIKSVRFPFDYIMSSNELAGGIIAEYSVMGKTLIRNALHISYLFGHLFFVVIFMGADKLPFDILSTDNFVPTIQEVQSIGILIFKYVLILGLTRIIRLGFPTINYDRVMRIIQNWVIPVMLLNMLLTITVPRVM